MSSTLPPALAELQSRVRAASAAGHRLSPTGGGSKAFCGPQTPAEPLSTRGLSGVISYEPSELVLRAWAGTPLAELEALLAQSGQCLPFEPPHFGPGATLGGMVAAGLAGPARASVGGVRDYVLGASIVNGRGQWLSFGGQVMKNVAGYDVSRLMVGSWGSFGVLADVSLKVLPTATATATFCFSAEQGAALRRLNHWASQALPLNASAWCEGGAQAGAGDAPQCWVRLRGAASAVRSGLAEMSAACGGHAVDEAHAQAFWSELREHQLSALAAPPPGTAQMSLWRLSLPSTTPPLMLPDGAGGQTIEWHGALRWVWATPAAGAGLRALTSAHGGSAELFRLGPACAEPKELSRQHPLAAPNARIAARLRAAFDPAGVFGPT